MTLSSLASHARFILPVDSFLLATTFPVSFSPLWLLKNKIRYGVLIVDMGPQKKSLPRLAACQKWLNVALIYLRYLRRRDKNSAQICSYFSFFFFFFSFVLFFMGGHLIMGAIRSKLVKQGKRWTLHALDSYCSGLTPGQRTKEIYGVGKRQQSWIHPMIHPSFADLAIRRNTNLKN